VSSSITARPYLPAPDACPPPGEKTCGATRPPIQPIAPAAMTIAGKGTPTAKTATNAAAAISQSPRCLSARVPMRHAACRTSAVTAGLMP